MLNLLNYRCHAIAAPSCAFKVPRCYERIYWVANTSSSSTADYYTPVRYYLVVLSVLFIHPLLTVMYQLNVHLTIMMFTSC